MNSSSPTQFLNRELSSIAFNRRVLEEANNKANPLLERVRFLAIVGSNLDEFTNVRVASLRDQVAASNTSISDDGLTPEAQLAAIREAVAALGQEAQNSWRQLQPLLDKENIRLVKAEALTAPQREKLEAYFQEHIFPVLTPLAIDPAHPFPHMPNRGFALIMHLTENTKEAKVLRAIVPMPPQIHRFVPLIAEANEHSFMLVEDVVALFLDKLFPNFTATDTGVFRILRDSEVEATEETDDLVGYYERLLKLRKRGDVIRLIVRKNMPADLHALLLRELRVQPVDVLEVDGVIGLMDLQELVKIERNDLKFPAFTPRYPERVRDFNGDIFAAIKAKDIILHHPYESFDVVVQFLQQAAQDPNVVAIRQTLYRTSQDSSVMRALIEAAEAGKSVTVMVELKARFDEEANLRWARNLERAGAQVIFGFIDLKTHAKIALVTRREGDGLRSYVHFGTGNYNSITSRVYTDLSLFSADPALCNDATKLFNFMTGYAKPEKMEKLIIAPLAMRKSLLELIAKEIAHVKAGKPGAIWAKMNSLVDAEIIRALYEASSAGVNINLIVRGICCLRPGVKGLSENIKVKSIVGRFLEHSRIVCFGDGHGLPAGEAKVFISSADWMPRNLNGRLEVMVPVENPTVHQQVLQEIMTHCLEDAAQSWELTNDGTYQRLSGGFSAQDYFLAHQSLSGRGSLAARSKKKAHRAKPGG